MARQMEAHRATERPMVRRVAQLERQRRQELLAPVAIATVVLLCSGYLPALRPAAVPIMLVWLTTAIALCLLALLLNRSNYVGSAVIVYILATLLFFGGAVYGVPIDTHGTLSYTNFPASHAYYFVLGVLPVIAAGLLLDLPWPIFINVVVIAMVQGSIWLIPHNDNGAYEAFSQSVGGPIFLALSVLLGQIMIFAFTLATARTLRRSLIAASQGYEMAAANEQIAARQRALETDIQQLQGAQARIANGELVRVTLQPNSELYPLGVSMNLMVERLLHLSQSGAELQRIERGLAVATQMVQRLSLGDLSVQPTPTGTVVDGLLASLVQVQGQISSWLQSVVHALERGAGDQHQILQFGSDLVMALRQVEDLLRRGGPSLGQDEIELVVLARQNAEQLLQVIQALSQRQQRLSEALSRLRMGTPLPTTDPPRATGTSFRTIPEA
jgi:hypothetical protein